MSPEISSALTQTESRPQFVAFGGFVKPEMYDVFGEYDLEDLSAREKAWISPTQFGEMLFNPSCDAKFVVDDVGLNTYEYKLIARSPQKLAETAFSNTLSDNDVDDERLAASKRSEIHALESKQAAMEEHGAKLKERRLDIKELKREARKPGYAHKTPERMRELINVAWQEFQTVLDVAHVQRGWDDEKRARAQAAFIYYLTQGSQPTRVRHWQAMLDVVDNYLGARIHILTKRDSLVTRLLAQKQSA